MVEILLCLSNPENMHEALLQAIDSGYTNIAEVTLRHPNYLEVFKRMRRMGETDLFFKVSPWSYCVAKGMVAIVSQIPQIPLRSSAGGLAADRFPWIYTAVSTLYHSESNDKKNINERDKEEMHLNLWPGNKTNNTK